VDPMPKEPGKVKKVDTMPLDDGAPMLMLTPIKRAHEPTVDHLERPAKLNTTFEQMVGLLEPTADLQLNGRNKEHTDPSPTAPLTLVTGKFKIGAGTPKAPDTIKVLDGDGELVIDYMTAIDAPPSLATTDQDRPPENGTPAQATDQAARGGGSSGAEAGHLRISPGNTLYMLPLETVIEFTRDPDSNGGAELILGSAAPKEGVCMRVQRTEMGFAPTGPTLLHMDALAALRGAATERVSQLSRYVATRLTIVREAAANGEIALNKIPTKNNPADTFTKTLQGGIFRRHRATVLGLSSRAYAFV
jgi:hypothetical protein